MADGARKRALRAARVATLGLVLATPGCYAGHSGPDARDDRDAGDSDAAIVDAGPGDARVPIDGGAVADAGTCLGSGPEWLACCEAIGWDWERGCAAWGPFVPPGEVA